MNWRHGPASEEFFYWDPEQLAECPWIVCRGFTNLLGNKCFSSALINYGVISQPAVLKSLGGRSGNATTVNTLV